MSKTYRTIQGDMWDKIAFEQMGSVLYTDQLIKANADHAAAVIFPAGVVLTIPAATSVKMVQVAIAQLDWGGEGRRGVLNCGTSIPYTSTLRMQKKSRNWENTTL